MLTLMGVSIFLIVMDRRFTILEKVGKGGDGIVLPVVWNITFPPMRNEDEEDEQYQEQYQEQHQAQYMEEYDSDTTQYIAPPKPQGI